VALVVVIVSFVLLDAPSASAAPPADPPPTLPNGSHVSPALDTVPVTGSAYSSAQASYDQIVAKLAHDRTRLTDATRRSAALGTQRAVLDRRIAEDTRIKSAADRQLAVLGVRLRHLALQAYVGIDDQAEAGAMLALDTDAVLEARAAVTLRREVTLTSHEQFEHQTGISNRAAKRLRANRTSRAAVVRDLDAQTAEQVSARADISWDGTEQVRRHEALRAARATAIVVDTNLPLVALDAYVAGAALIDQRKPGCHMTWSLLAGIGQVESHQGTYGGSTLRPDGTVSRPIFGVPLDGTAGNEKIVTGAGAYSRAEGPMQFLPSTWATVAVDGDGDGRTDPQNLYDAAATAASYLCRRDPDVSTDAGRRAAILTYNFSGSYVAQVSSYAADYASALPRIPASNEDAPTGASGN
jgi:membrane-bound lytic murein transglycosylase B